ncbi:hypothetical protein B0J11DRAFT_527579 [Dendryphion nanum]|uniref:Uncharacterized protein n=1 Tax=Dendryphion nanum TaxID=256645 RepID=A0A9P9DU43_9PLEO|nr:hypothetical protein B0J11DRAFT_527579 [Dendryphion nanum]
MPPTIILITGANRGLGLGLVGRYLALPDHTVIATVRNPLHPTSVALLSLPSGTDSTLIVLRLDVSVEQDSFNAVRELGQKHAIDHLDIVIANAGISAIWPTVADLKLDDLKAHVEPNVYGVVSLYQATLPLLKKSTREPKFLPMGSSAGFITNQLPIPNAAYGPSKAMLHWLTVRINAEEDWLNAYVLSPGWVQTELGNAGAVFFGLEQAHVTVEDSCNGMVEIIAKSTKKDHGGKMVSYDGSIESTW